MEYNDINRIIDYIENQDLSNKTIILNIPRGESPSWNLLKAYSDNANFMVCLEDLYMAPICVENGIKFYWSYAISNFCELRQVVNLNPCYLLLAAPISFSLDKVKQITDIPIRLVANGSYPYIPRKNCLYSDWIRPEDVQEYEKYVDALEFYTDNSLQRESVLFHIYAENKEWPGNLNLLINELHIDVDNRALPDDFGKIRSTCGMRCQENNSCHFCSTSMEFSTSIRNKYIMDRKKEDN